MLWRGARRRCPRCGSGHLFTTWFSLAERCPSCRLRLERDHDFFLGAYLVSLAVTEGLLALVMLVYILRINADPDTSKLPVLVAGLVVVVVTPLVTYAFSRTIWAAIDLAMRPVSSEEEDRRPARSS